MYRHLSFFFFQLFIIIPIQAQVFTDLNNNLDLNNLALGVENNNYISITYKPISFIGINFSNSFYTERLSYQRFYAQCYFALFERKSFTFNSAFKLFGNYETGFLASYISPQLSINFKMIYFSIELNSTVATTFKIYPKYSLGVNLKNKFAFVEYGTPFYGYSIEKVTNLGIILKENKILIKAQFQVPNTFDYQHTRFLISFLYLIN